MFNFQKEVVLNNIADAIKKEIITVVKPGGDQEQSIPKIDPKVRFHDGGEYFAKYIVDSKIYRTLPIDGENFKLTLMVPEDIKGQHIQILIELGLDNDYRGDYGSALWYFRKPILVDVVLPPVPSNGTQGAEVAAEVIYKAIKSAIPEEYKFVNVSWEKGSGNVIISGSDSYQKVRKVVISRYECDDRCAGSSEEPVEIVSASTGELEKGSTYFSYKKNNVEFGTYNYVLHNLRLPTYANLRFTSPSAPEMPIQGVAYAQYSFAYCVPRGIHFGGLSVAGQANYSTTFHTFFVPVQKNEEGQYEGNADFEKLFTDLGMTNPFEDIGRDGKHKITVLPDAYASSQDLKAAAAIKANSDADAAVKAQVDKNKAAIKGNHPEADV